MYKEAYPSISVIDDPCEAYIIKPTNGVYSLEDFLLNRLMLGLMEVGHDALEGNAGEYMAYHKSMNIAMEKMEFSKLLLLQESVLIWIITISFIILAFICVSSGFFGELPWLAAMAAFPWTAYGASQAFYYRKSEKENTKDGIKFETVMAQIQTNDADLPVDESNFVENANG